MNLHRRAAPSLFAAGLAVVAAGGLLVACSRPTAVPTGQNFEPGPYNTYQPPPKPGESGYPPKSAPTYAPEGYPAPGEAVTATLAGGVVTSTVPAETPTAAATGAADATGTP